MIDRKALQADLKKLTSRLVDDLRERAEKDAATAAHLTAEYKKAKDAGRTALAYEAWREDPLTQGAVAWVLSCVFVRFLEDNGLLDERGGVPRRLLAAADPALRPLAEGHYAEQIRQFPAHSDREFLLSLFDELGNLPGAKHLFDRSKGHNPIYSLAPTADGAKELLKFFQRMDPATGKLLHDFTDAGWETRFLGDLYQDLSDHAKEKYALLQTPHFVEAFLLDRTLTPAIEEFGYEAVTLIDPACGSGHFLLGAFGRLVDLWRQNQPALPAPAIAQKALSAVFGVDLNPFAAAIARFRLLVAALKAAGTSRLAAAPDFTVNVAVGDSLLHGPKPGTGKEDTQRFLLGEDPLGHLYETEDREELRAILFRRYHAVVANPPYITVKDPGLNQLYRDRFTTCKGKYSLVNPFLERCFDLMEQGDATRPAGYLGVIVSNAFMKREFGSKLIEEYLPRRDVTHVIDTSGAYIPGHGTPTVILLGRGRAPVGETVRTVMGIRGEPAPPESPELGLVWTAIVKQVDQPGSQSEFVSVADLPRERFAKHPWSLGGGGAADLKLTIDSAGNERLGGLVESIGFASFTGLDEVFLSTRVSLARAQIQSELIRIMIIGEAIRDWGTDDAVSAFVPYCGTAPIDLEPSSPWALFLWPFRSTIGAVLSFGGKTRAESGDQWWTWYRWVPEKYKTALSITFAFVATHNHFVLDRGGKVFNRSAPVIKLPAAATEDDHLALLGLLNSSTAGFWFRQVCHDKGNRAGERAMGADDWEMFLEFAGGNVADFPVPSTHPIDLARHLDSLSRQRSLLLPSSLAANSAPTREALGEVRERCISLRRRQIALQEELDWETYHSYSLISDRLILPVDAVPEIDFGERAFEIVLARQLASGESNDQWFKRHKATPITEIPAHWPEPYRRLVERRLEVIASNPNVNLIERPEYKRRWNTEPWEEQEKRALRGWLLARLERPDCWPEPELQSAVRLADRVRHDPDFRQVAELYTARPDVDVEKLVAELVLEEGVPYLAALRYTDDGLRKRALWERTWDLQRREDSGEKLDIPVPPKYGREDFLKGTYWSHRGKLDVPKEEFILYPGAERDVDPSPVVGWAGWDHLQRAKALANYYERVKVNEGWPKERLLPLLAGLHELVPWLKLWHDQLDPAFGLGMGTYFAQFVDEECRALGTLPEKLGEWRPEKRAGKARGRRKKEG